TVVVEADLVEIVEPAIHRKIAAPIVRVAPKADRLAGIDLVDQVGTTADERGQRCLLELIRINEVLREDRHQAHDQRHLAVAALIEGEAHLALAGLLYLGDFTIIEAMVWPPVIAQQGM